ncbi:ComEC/Rec2 family competence protein [Nannocystis pusilla]|uniref:ComEC/Rec2 family competence protein n=1 Tax=Nannocystis pusilla TaxID=889268 RepID=UPI003B789824
MAILVHPTAPRGLVAQSWRVSFGTLPIVLVHFGQASLIGVAANVIAVPVFTLWVLPLGIAGMVAARWWGPEALRPAALGGQVIIDLAGLAARVPEPPWWLLAGMAGVGLVLRLTLRRPAVLRWVPGVLPCVGVLAALAYLGRERSPEPPREWVAIGAAQRCDHRAGAGGSLAGVRARPVAGARGVAGAAGGAGLPRGGGRGRTP